MKRTVDKTSRRYKRLRRRKIIFVLEIFVLLLVCTAAFAYFYIDGKLNKMQTQTLDINNVVVNKEVETNETLKGFTNIALFGLDTREGNLAEANGDTMIIASINNDTKEVKLVSVYRDTYLKLGDDFFRKANAAYANGGPEMAVNMLNTNLDLDIKNYISVDFNALAEVVDLLGGLELTVDYGESVHLNNYCVETSKVTGKEYENLPGAGTYTMNGVQSVAYARIRYTAGNDFKRTERQREVIAKIVEKAKKADLSTLNNIMDKVFPMVLTNLSKSDIWSMGVNMLSYSMGDTCGFPFAHRTSNDSNSHEIPVTLSSNAVELHEFLFGDSQYTPSSNLEEISEEIIAKYGYDDESLASRENYKLNGDNVDQETAETSTESQ